MGLSREQRDETLRDLIAIMDEGELTGLTYEDKDAKVKIGLERQPKMPAPASLPLMAERVEQLLHARDGATGVTAGAPSAPVAGTTPDEAGIVRSPMVGTFYAAPSPDEDPFVKVGQEVLTGQTLGIVEAMKMMNEIPAPVPGIITEIYVANGTQVEYDQPLFAISTEASA